ncbi:MAG: Hpt domain-containing protein [SAR324 cluster bacterium]|nr:Hpt domain-containing protein [SAR324 cluster bacterium]
MESEIRELVEAFVVESREMMETLEPILIGLTSVTSTEEIESGINNVFRLFHTIKGGAGFLNLKYIERLTHRSENILQVLRKEPRKFNPDYVDTLTESCDLMHKMLDQTEQQYSDQGFEDEVGTLIQHLEQIYAGLQDEKIIQVATGIPQKTKPAPKEPVAQQVPATQPQKNQVPPAPKQAVVQPIAGTQPQQPQIKSSTQADLPPEWIDIGSADISITPEMMASFIQEGEEQLQSLEDILMVMKQIPGDTAEHEFIETAFRNVHTLKGNAGFLNVQPIESSSHRAENLMGEVREGTRKIDEAAIQGLLMYVDVIRQGFKQIESRKQINAALFRPLEEHLEALIDGRLPDQHDAFDTSSVQLPDNSEKESSEHGDGDEQEAESPAVTVNNDQPIVEYKVTITPEMNQIFVNEGLEQLQSLEDAMLVISQLPEDDSVSAFIDTAFRNVHTVKGNAGFLNVSPIESLSHHAENLLGNIRDGKIIIHENHIQALLKYIDVIRQHLKNMSQGINLNASLNVDTEQQLLSALQGRPDKPEASATPPKSVPSTRSAPATGTQPTENKQPAQQKPAEPVLNVTEKEKTVSSGKAQTPPSSSVAQATRESAVEHKHPIPVAATKTSTVRQEIRVSTDKIDQLVNLIGELVIGEAMLANHLNNIAGNEYSEQFITQLNKNIRDLQEVAMSMRMIPVSGVFRKMIRVVHDVSKKVNKPVVLDLVGEETEVDKTVVEQIADPLLHIVRNAVDHGIDTPEERKAAGKPETGNIRLEAKHAGNEILIIIQDDGRGLNEERILAKAIEKNIVSPEDQLTPNEIWNLVFAPGFSTSEQVTDLSGRGVGMDVVKRNIEQLRGRIDIFSEKGKGSRFVLRLPLTLAIIDGMLVKVGNSVYAIPIVEIQESVKPKETDITRMSDGTEVIQIREQLLPVIRLHRLHHIPTQITDLNDGLLIVIESENRRLCLFVDELIGQQQIVIKALPEYLGDLPYLSGCTILGDGSISMILDTSKFFMALQ